MIGGSYKPMIKKKLCLLGSFGVGKTSLIRKFVHNVYSDTYLSTVGVKVDKKSLFLPEGQEVILIIWDLEGRDDFEKVSDTYLRGMSGYFLVADGTRPDTLESARATGKSMRILFPGVCSSLILNKADLVDAWHVSAADTADFTHLGIASFRTSAALGQGVEEAFLDIAGKMIGSGDE
jgi:small GTP-binding protein